MVPPSSHPEPAAVNRVVLRFPFISAHENHEHIIRDIGRDIRRLERRFRRRLRAAWRKRGRRVRP
jgi:hypothetical protein